MKVIYKYELAVEDVCWINMPKGAEILSIQNQFNALFIWAIVDPQAAVERRAFYVVGTGHPIADNNKKFIATVQQGSFVWHIFELITNFKTTSSTN